jgi:hypothetical protein
MEGPAAAEGGGRLRASHDDRDRVTHQLKTAFTEGRLTEEELDERTGQALAAKTYAELDVLTEDLPGVPRQDGSPGLPVPSQPVLSEPNLSQAAPEGVPSPARGLGLVRASAISAGALGLAFVLAYSGNLIDNAWQGPGPGPDHGWTRLLLLLATLSVVTAFSVMGYAVSTTLDEMRTRHRGD